MHSPNCLDFICLEDPTITETFYGAECHMQFLDWVFENCTNCTFLAHNTSRVAREIRLNAKYIIVFRGASDSEPLLRLGHQLFPRRPKYFEEAVDYCMAKDNGYLIIQLYPNIADDERLMTDIFGENPYKSTVVFKAIN
ncbi:hypothetical protein RvY_00105 [Ramazzottius varieornatus]|uniref:Uncharacterized protein n=1 Tax=Ramazzottius varieornatus TaxID=947166 RepID=A0A1D1UHX9_RAMVA|nr:hypothetical protein RvY_00105 [Ramazzottius varieornatus]